MGAISGYTAATAFGYGDVLLGNDDSTTKKFSPAAVRAGIGIPFPHVDDYGADPTGATDSTAAFNAAYAASSTGIIQGGIGTYAITKFAASSTIRGFIGAGKNFTYVRASLAQSPNNSGQPIWWIAGAGEGTRKTLLANALEYEANASSHGWEAVIEATSHGWSVNDWLLVGSTEAWPNSAESAKAGEIARVARVDNLNKVTLAAKLHDDYTTANSAFAVKLTLIGPIVFRDFTFVNTAPLTGTNDVIYLQYCNDVTVERVNFVDADEECIQAQYCINGRVKDCHTLRGGANQTTGLYQGTLLLVQAASQDWEMSGCSGYQSWHLFTTGGLAGEGVPRNIHVHHNWYNGGSPDTVDDGAAPFDTHAEGDNIYFDNNVVHGATRYGFTGRCPNVHYSDNVTDGAQDASIVLRDGADHCTIANHRALNSKHSPLTGGDSVVIEADYCTITDLYIDGVEQHGLRVSADYCTVDGYTILRAGLDGGYAVYLDTCTGLRMRNGFIGDSASGVNNAGTLTDAHIEAPQFRNVTTLTNGSPPFDYQSPTFAASFTPNPHNGEVVKVGTLTNNVTINAVAQPYIGQRMTIITTQDGTGSRTHTWNAVYKGPNSGGPTAATTTANKVNQWSFVYDGSSWWQTAANVGMG